MMTTMMLMMMMLMMMKTIDGPVGDRRGVGDLYNIVL